jgi:MFS family permease
MKRIAEMRYRGILLLGAAVAATIVFGLLAHGSLGKRFDPRTLLVIGFISFIAVNALCFLANLLIALPAMLKIKTEDELEHTMVPVLRGEPTHLGNYASQLFGWLAVLSIGLTVGAAILLVLKHYRVAF